MTARSRVRRVALGVGLVLSALGVSCAVLTGAVDRELDTGDAASPDRRDRDVVVRPEASTPGGDDDGGGEDDDAGVIRIKIGVSWTSPNGATWQTNDFGATWIDGFSGATHPVIVPAPQPDIPSNDYTVHATVNATSDGEFGILARVSTDSTLLLSSEFGTVNAPWLGIMGPPQWNPDKLADASVYTFQPGRYKFWLRVHGNAAEGKMWRASEPEPSSPQMRITGVDATSRGIGFYTYNVPDVVLEQLEVTVP